MHYCRDRQPNFDEQETTAKRFEQPQPSKFQKQAFPLPAAGGGERGTPR